uniref:Phage ABA sandwich domain-containing protein n=1 Tax=bacterium enrichment culture clone fosmid MGS-K1 TaxID=1549356 RepID=A0A0B5KH84_9BACT|nr:hypothetical protein [bacterium enrichment culture clone fosmid MGS-K1]
MTKDEILALESGRYMDGLIIVALDLPRALDTPGGSRLMAYSTDRADVWRVVNKLQTSGFGICLYSYPTNYTWFCSVMGKEYIHSAHAGRAPEAICKAALLAVQEVEKGV